MRAVFQAHDVTETHFISVVEFSLNISICSISKLSDLRDGLYAELLLRCYILTVDTAAVSLCQLTPDGNYLPTLSINGRILILNKVAPRVGNVTFNQRWAAYAAGLGVPSMTDSFWIGNEKLYRLTSGSKTYRLRVEVYNDSFFIFNFFSRIPMSHTCSCVYTFN